MLRVPEFRSSQRGTDPMPYRGRDRRSLMTPHHGTGQPFIVAGFALVFLTAVVILLGAPNDDLSSVAASFELSAGALGIVAATLGIVRWRLAGDARALWMATAVG